MNRHSVSLLGSDLALRNAARVERSRLLEEIENHGPITLDLSAVQSVSGPFADELFGVLTNTFGLEWVVSHVRVKGAKASVLRAIAEAVNYRVSSGDRARLTTPPHIY